MHFDNNFVINCLSIVTYRAHKNDSSKYDNQLSIADVLFFFISANVTFDITTPHEMTVTFLFHFSDSCLVSATAAEQSAAVYSGTRSVANSASRTQNVEPKTNDNNLSPVNLSSVTFLTVYQLTCRFSRNNLANLPNKPAPFCLVFLYRD